jgi:phage terminase large subunit
VTATTLEHTYRPRGACRELLAARDGEVLISGPAGTGKSRACLEKIHLMCLLNPGMRALIVRQTLVSLSNTGLKTYQEKVAAECLANGSVKWFGGSQREAPAFNYSNGSTINVGGMDKPTKVMSSEYDVIYVQEATELVENGWEALTTRLRNGVVSFQQLIADCNPDKPTHWLKVRADAGRTRMLESRHDDNPVLYGEDGQPTEFGADYIAKLDRLTGPRKLRLRHGIWAASEGLVYEEFDPAVHVIDGFPKEDADGNVIRRDSPTPPKSWPRYWSVDFGYTNPFVLQCWAVDPDGRLYLYREQYKTKTLVEAHAKRALELATYSKDSSWGNKGEWKEPRPIRVVCDHDAEGRATLAQSLGQPTTAARKNVIDGIQAVQSRLELAGDGLPRLFIYRNARKDLDRELADSKKPTSTLEEFAGYVWDGTTDKPKETPLKLDDHGSDALRYMVAEFDLKPRVGLRIM